MIGHKELGEAYISKILSLGVEISEAKTHVSCDSFEFAKRFFSQGEEISPFPISSIADGTKNYVLLVAAMMGEEKKGFPLGDNIPVGISELYSDLGMPRS